MKPYQQIKCNRCNGHGLITSWSYGVKEPDECRECGGSGTIIRYESGTYAQYPGGPLLGRATKAERETAPV